MRTIAYIFKVILGISCALLVSCQAEQESVNEKVESAKVTATAELISLKNATIGPPNISNMWQYKIQKMAAENTLVKKGDVILEFDGDRVKNDLVSRKSRLNAEVKKAESNKLKDDATTQNLILKLAEAEMEYNKAKRKAEIVDASRSNIERLKQQADYRYQTEALAQAKQKLAHHKKSMGINVKVSEGKIKIMQSRVNRILQEIEKLSVKAPKDGLVMYKEDRNGEKVAVGETVYMGRSLLELPSLDAIALKAEFAEPDKAKLKQGQAVRVIFEAYPEMSYMGTITKLGHAFYPKSTNNPKVIFDAQIELGKARPDVMRPGMKAKIEVVDS
jgi:HlyD family secretion protein